ncbi:MAG: BREX-4 system phosphatase PglZ [Candidatus Methanoplasma sp.]|jgi:hypothetical protein|nr:BREX-4 system phosphatase PglZ [Candidatus Methanoplasma sp.]
MQTESVKKYLSSPVTVPYFMFVSDRQYGAVLNELRTYGQDIVSMSGFCNYRDKLPDTDALLTHIKVADVNSKGKKIVVTGLGETLALRGSAEATKMLYRLKDFNIGSAKVVLLLRGLAPLISELQIDTRLDNRRYDIIDGAECSLSFTVSDPTIGLQAIPGFKAMLAELEKGQCGTVAVNTAVSLDNAMFPVHRVSSAYDGILSAAKGFSLPRSYGNDEHWGKLLSEFSQSDGSIDRIFERRGFSSDPKSDIYAHISGGDYESWLYFIFLKSKAGTLKNGYLRFVLDMTHRFEDFSENILNAIIDVPHADRRFVTFRQGRNNLVNGFPESDISSFVVNNRRVESESIYRLTDNTIVEREEIIAWVSKNGMVPEIKNIYPLLAAYAKRYIFKCPDPEGTLTDYFEAYKRQKLSNELEPEFLKEVDRLARPPRIFNRLPTRDEVIDCMNKCETSLYWLDALGAEYLAVIECLAQNLGLSIDVKIARAELPTITRFNQEFYRAWQGSKEMSKKLDEIKHKDEGGYNFADNKLPIHLAKELDVIREVMNKAANTLRRGRYIRFLIVSDHGASRLAVLRRKEEKYTTDTKGEHSGRCCKMFRPCDLPFASEENGYVVLADYGRFEGSRAANVEVHGGASLEEVVIPIIELSLKDGSINVSLVEETVTSDSRTGAEITLFFNSRVQDVSVLIGGKSYSASQTDENHHSVKLPDLKRAGEYQAEVYIRDELIGRIAIKTQGKSGKVNDDFDSLF